MPRMIFFKLSLFFSLFTYSSMVLAADAGKDATLCSGGAIQLTATGGQNYIWSTGETDAVIIVSPSTSTTYTVTVTSGGNSETDEVTVNIDNTCGTSFECDGKLVLTTNQGPPTAFDWVNTDGTNVSFNELIPDVSGLSLNSTAYNPLDNYVYANGGNKIYRINADGGATNLGTPTGLPTNGSYYVGAIDKDGQYYMVDNKGGQRALYVINIGTMEATKIGDIAGGFADIAFHPITKVLYGFLNNQDRIYSISVTDASLTAVGPVQDTNVITMLGGIFFSADGTVYGYGKNKNSSVQNTFYRGDTNFNFTALGTGPSATGVDGSSCANGISVSKATEQTTCGVVPGGTITYTFTMANAGLAVGGIELEDILPVGATFDTAQGVYNITTSSDEPDGENLEIGTTIFSNGNETLNLIIDNLPIGTAHTFQLDVMIPNPYVGGSTFTNQATLSNLPIGLPATILSDDPVSGSLGDGTIFNIFQVDLDTDDSSGAEGNDYEAVHCTNENTLIADSDMEVSYQGGQITTATIALTNPQDGASESIALTGNHPNISINAASTQTNIILTNNGAATPADFEAAIESILYSNQAVSPTLTPDRIIEVSLEDDCGIVSNTA
ncbi:MAG: hypothetical protein AB8B69_14175, partial [Chitinophagales bacterium]